jgi:hypothetical protein
LNRRRDERGDPARVQRDQRCEHEGQRPAQPSALRSALHRRSSGVIDLQIVEIVHQPELHEEQ